MSNTTRKAILSIYLLKLLNEPFTTLFVMLSFILKKDLGASLLWISLFVSLKPSAAVFSFYYDTVIKKLEISARTSFMMASLFAILPFAFVPLFPSVSFMVIASTLYMIFSRASLGPWMELLRRHLAKDEREKSFSAASSLAYMLGMVISIGLGIILEYNSKSWHWLFPAFALVSLVGILTQNLLLPNSYTSVSVSSSMKQSAKDHILSPFQSAVALMKNNKAFRKFQWGFMTAGFGLMMAIATVPHYFVDFLDLSYQDFAHSRLLYVGIGFVVSSPLWVRMLSKRSILFLTTFVCLGFAVYMGLILLASPFKPALYLAHITYGVAQGGSHLVWHMSGPTFAEGQEESIPYTRINVLMVGLRGLVAPLFGCMLYGLIGPIMTWGFAIVLCLFGSMIALRASVEEKSTMSAKAT